MDYLGCESQDSVVIVGCDNILDPKAGKRDETREILWFPLQTAIYKEVSNEVVVIWPETRRKGTAPLVCWSEEKKKSHVQAEMRCATPTFGLLNHHFRHEFEAQGNRETKTPSSRDLSSSKAICCSSWTCVSHKGRDKHEITRQDSLVPQKSQIGCMHLDTYMYCITLHWITLLYISCY